MAKPSIQLIQALKNTAKHLEQSSDYQWGHMGSCNCGFLAQEITRLSKHQIHSRAMQRYGDWNEQLNDYCPTSGMLIDDLISQMLAAGLDTDDLKKLEKLSDQNILKKLSSGRHFLERNKKADVIEYLYAWADVLEEKLLENIHIEAIDLKLTHGLLQTT
jgi:hypothetical protein